MSRICSIVLCFVLVLFCGVAADAQCRGGRCGGGGFFGGRMFGGGCSNGQCSSMSYSYRGPVRRGCGCGCADCTGTADCPCDCQDCVCRDQPVRTRRFAIDPSRRVYVAGQVARSRTVTRSRTVIFGGGNCANGRCSRW